MVTKKWLPIPVVLFLFAGAMSFSCLTDAQENWFQKGLTALQDHNYDDAIKAFTLSIETFPQDYEAFNNRGIAWFYKNEHDKAIEDYSKAININPEFTEAYNNRGAAWFYLKEFQKAVDDCSRVIALKPDDYEAYNYRGTARYYLGQYQAAIDDCTRSIELNPESAVTYDRLAVILTICPDERFRDPFKAVALAKKATALSPEAEYLDTLAAAYAQTGEFGEAAGAQNLAVELLKREHQTSKLPAYSKRLQKYRSLETRMVARQADKPEKERKQDKSLSSRPPESKPVTETQTPVKAEISYRHGRFPYLVQIGSFQDRGEASETALRYRAKGDPVLTSPARIVGKGLWHRIFAGCYPDLDSAGRSLAALKKRNFKDSFITRLPYSVVIGDAASIDRLQENSAKLERLGYIAVALPDDRDPNIVWLISGAFKNENEAKRFANQLIAGGFPATVVRR